jgi:protein-L-isoaspartate(D-aspartate) O-methyltransferase
MRTVPRHLFVPEHLRDMAYSDTPLPIGYGQTISQPRMVATMLEIAELHPADRVLEIGAGSGYQAALLSRLVTDVYTIEIVPELAELARRNLERAGIGDVHVITADGSEGWAAAAPYAAIIVAAGALEIPLPLIHQLAPYGRLVIPVGAAPYQVLTRVRRTPRGVTTEDFDLCAFVPLVHGDRRYAV